jgi:hypothetical protein
VRASHEARSSWELISATESQSLTLHFSRELLPLSTAEITEAGLDPAGLSFGCQL